MVAKVLGLMKDNVNRTIYTDGWSGDEMSDSCDETSTSFGQEAESTRKTKKRRRRIRKTFNVFPGEEEGEAVEDDDAERGYEQSEPEGEAHIDDEDEGVRREGDELDGDVGVEVGPRKVYDNDDLGVEGMDGEARLANRGALEHLLGCGAPSCGILAPLVNID